jgi:hypothetical protein
MGISISVLKFTDQQIRGFIENTKQLEDLLNGAIVYDRVKCYRLFSFWHGIHHYLLTIEAGREDLPLCALSKGDVEYMGLSDHAHAIYSVTTKALVKELAALSETTLWERFHARMRKAYNLQDFYKYNIGQAWTFPEYLENTFRELMSYFNVLKTVAAEAAKEDKGLVFCRYEDW